MRKILFLMIPLVFTFVSCGDSTTTKNTSYQTLYATVSGNITTVNGVPMNASKYGRSCVVADPNTELVIETIINTKSRDNSSAAIGAIIWENKTVLEVQPINGTEGNSQVLIANRGIPTGPITIGSSFAGEITVSVAIFPEPVPNEEGLLSKNEYELWVTTYVQEYKGEKPTSPEGWFQMFWGVLYTAPIPPEGTESACLGILGR